ncbi:MAG: ABC transporter permease [Chloroflexi bacterium]|nr:ABC transporter permease [Chloroflexota bacterium]
MFQSGPFTINSPLILVLRNLRARWVRTILTALGIIVGVAAMVAVNATNNSTLDSITRFFDETAGQSDLIVEAPVSGERFDEAVLNEVRRFDEVTAAAPGIMGVTVSADEADNWEEQYSAGGSIVPGTNFWLMGRDIAADEGIHDYQLVDGRLLKPGETSYNMLLVDEYAEEKGVEVGEDFAILTPLDGIVSFRVVGLIDKEGIGQTNEGVIGIVPLNVVQELFGAAGQIDNIEIVVTDEIANNTETLEALRQDMDAALGLDFAVKLPASRGEQVTDSLQSYQQGLNFFSVVSLFVGSFLIYNAFAMTIVERTREIGMLRAVGTTRRQVMGMVLTEALFLGVVGSFVGVGAGLLLARLLVSTMSGFTGRPIDQVVATPQNVVTAVLVGIFVTLLAAVIPAWQAARISPMQALHVKGQTDDRRMVRTGLKFGPLMIFTALLVLYEVPLRPEAAFYLGSAMIFMLLLGATLSIPLIAPWVERGIRPFIILIFGNEGRLGSSNINRARGRTALTVAALMVGISMVVGINGLTQSFETDINQWMSTALGGDLFVQSPLRIKPDVEARLLALPGVEAVTRTSFVGTQMQTAAGDDEFAIFVAIDPATYQDVRGLRVQDGPDETEALRLLAEGDNVFISADSANKFNLDVGDTITLQTRRGKREFTIVAIVIDFGAGQTINLTGSWGDLRRYFGVNDINSFAVKLAPDADVEMLTDVIENRIGGNQHLSVQTKAEFEAKIQDLSAQAFSLFDVLGLIGLVVAALGVINTMLMNVMERTRELGGLRSLGMTRRQIRRMILAEAATIGLIGGLFGVLFGAVLANVFVIGLRSIGGFILSSQVPVVPMIYSFFIALIVALLAAWYPAVRASNVNIIEAIKHE